jgi:hypothetical protein
MLWGCLIVFLVGLNWKEPGYSVRKVLEGYTARNQMARRRRTGRRIIENSIVAACITVILAAFLSIFYVERYEYNVPNKVNVLMARDQSITLFLIDGEIREKSIRSSIDADEYFRIVSGLQIVDQTLDRIYPRTYT